MAVVDDRAPTIFEALRDFWDDEVGGAQFITGRKVGSECCG